MLNTIRKTKTWLPIAIVLAGSFYAGAALRTQQVTTTTVERRASVQANALLNFAPESAPVTLRTSGKDGTADRALFRSVYQLLKGYYVDPITSQRETEMARGAVQGMVDSLGDPDSRFLEPKDRKLLEDASNGYFHGIGAVLSLRKEKIGHVGALTVKSVGQPDGANQGAGQIDSIKIIVVAPMPGSPAEAAGLRAGDSIEYLNSKWIITRSPFAEIDLEKLEKKLRNREIDEFTVQKAWEAADKKLRDGVVIPTVLDALNSTAKGELKIRVTRPGQPKPLDLKIQCRDTQVDPVTSRDLQDGIAYLRVSQFNQRAVMRFAQEFKSVQSSNARGLVLDLRNNPGGLLSAAANISGKLLGEGAFATIEEKNGKRTITIPQGQKTRLPVVVLINGGTASVSELMAGSLRDGIGAVLEGSATFGDGLIQTPLMLSDGSSAVVTTGKMLTRGGSDFDRKGIQPDVKTAQDRQTDSQLEEAKKILLSKLGKA